jgi:UDP-glucose 4-epimerase
MKPSNVLVTGGAGYIGSHAGLAFLDRGYAVVVIDNLSTGFRSAVPPGATFVEGDAGDRSLVSQLLREHDIDLVVHFAGSIVVPESVVNPLKYYADNTCVSRNLIECCVETGVGSFVFSSTAAVYGAPAAMPVSEATPTQPESPYGTSKLMTEWILRDAASAYDFRYVALRYFNVAGADPQGRAGQSTRNATHLIKVATEAACGKRNYIEVYGEDYETADGTCVRDFIHVSDLADAHVRACEHLAGGGESLVLNCGYGRGHSVREVLAVVERVSGTRLDIRPAARRAGDTPILVADPSKLVRLLGWRARHDDLDVIVGSALEWERRLA